MKKFLKCAAAAFVLCVSSTQLVAAAETSVVIDGQKLQLDAAPRVINDRMMVPMRGVMEALGYSVQWQEQTQTVLAAQESIEIRMPLNSTWISINEVDKEIDTPAVLVGGRTFVPLRFVAECAGATVNWDSRANMVSIITPRTIPADMEHLGNVLWEYHGNDTTVTIPPAIKTIRAGAFIRSNVQTVVIQHNVKLCPNAFSGAKHLTDIYFYGKDVQHIYSYYDGTTCLHGEMACLDPLCSTYSRGVYTTILSDEWTDVDAYESKTLTIHGYRGSTAERFVQLINENPTLFHSPQKVLFQPIEE